MQYCELQNVIIYTKFYDPHHMICNKTFCAQNMPSRSNRFGNSEVISNTNGLILLFYTEIYVILTNYDLLAKILGGSQIVVF